MKAASGACLPERTAGFTEIAAGIAVDMDIPDKLVALAVEACVAGADFNAMAASVFAGQAV